MNQVEEKPPHADIAKRLLWLRGRTKLSQREFAKTIGASASQYANWEQGAQRLSLNGALRIVEVYGVTLDFLYRERLDTLPAHLASSWASTPRD